MLYGAGIWIPTFTPKITQSCRQIYQHDWSIWDLFGDYYTWLVVSIPQKNMSSSIGMTIFNLWKVIIQLCSSHQQPDCRYIYINPNKSNKSPFSYGFPMVFLWFQTNHQPAVHWTWHQHGLPEVDVPTSARGHMGWVKHHKVWNVWEIV